MTADGRKELPNGWMFVPLKSVARLIPGGTPDTDNELYWADEGGESWVAIGDMSKTDLVASTEKSVTPAGRLSARLSTGSIGTVLFAMYASVGAVSTLGIEASWNQALLGVDPIGDKSDSKFLAYSLISARDELPYLYRSNTQNNLNASQVGALRICLPPLDEQRQIAEYLDRETGKIDELIAKQEHLVAALGERLTALWSNQIDELAQKYPTVSIRRVIDSIVDGPFGSSLTSAHYSEDGARVIRLGNIGIFVFKNFDQAYIPLDYARELSAHAVSAGDVIVAGLGDEKMPLGRAAVVPDTLGIALVKADCYRVRANNRVSSEYLAWALSSPQLREQFKLLSRGSTRQRLNTTVVRDPTIPLPPRAAQDAAVQRFSVENAQMDQVVLKAVQVVEMLRERRAALISAAVTGKIDVRGL